MVHFLLTSRYEHARQMKRSRKYQKTLRTIPGRVIREIERKDPRADEELEDLLDIAKRVHRRERHDREPVEKKP